jgi:hypothetical protein
VLTGFAVCEAITWSEVDYAPRRMSGVTHPVTVLSPDEVHERVARAGATPGSCLVAVGQWPSKVEDRWADRVGLLDVAGRPRLLLDAWVYRDSVPDVCTRFPGSSMGGWDVMFATSWRWAWGGSPFSVWSRRGWRVRVLGPGRVVIRTFGFEREHEARSIRAEASKGWVVHRVGVSTSDGKTVRIARRTEIGPLVDFTYDGLNLLADAGWASALGKALATALEVPYDASDPSLR